MIFCKIISSFKEQQKRSTSEKRLKIFQIKLNEIMRENLENEKSRLLQIIQLVYYTISRSHCSLQFTCIKSKEHLPASHEERRKEMWFWRAPSLNFTTSFLAHVQQHLQFSTVNNQQHNTMRHIIQKSISNSVCSVCHIYFSMHNNFALNEMTPQLLFMCLEERYFSAHMLFPYTCVLKLHL